MFKLVNHRAGKIKLNNGKVLRRGLSATVESTVLVDSDLQRLIQRGKVSVSRIEQSAPMVKLGVVESEVREPVVAEPVVAEPVVAEPVVAEPVVAEPVVEAPPKDPTIKRRSRRKSSTKKED
jgi:hypothetical protein